MDRMSERAARLGIETEYWDGLGRHRTADPEALARLIDALSASGEQAPGGEASAEASARAVPTPAYQGGDETPRRFWVLAVQLYAVRSRRNWGHGDFTDLAGLIELAGDLGAAGIGLNPIHALFDEWAEASPYSPNSRLFLNPRYIDVEAVPEFPGLRAVGMAEEVEALRQPDLIDYAGVVAAKTRALRVAFDVFRRNADPTRQGEFENFRRERGSTLTQFACFEHLRRKFKRPWWEWPQEWRRPDGEAVERLRSVEDDVVFYEFIQWIAHEQLTRCLERVRARRLPIGLYLDVAVGVRAEGFDGWSDQDSMLASVEVGAPPDMLNTAGQKWGLVGFNPVALARQACEPFRRVLRASMRYAGAIRLDHVMGLARLFLIPSGMKADQGALCPLSVRGAACRDRAGERRQQCIVIGEDLGTVPANFRETLADWGLWSYQVMLFERVAGGAFRAPEDYRENALATFATHDMPTFLGWCERRDLAVKRELAIDPGETDDERSAALAALRDALGGRGLPSLDFLSVLKYLAAARSRLLVVTLEDALGITEQVNLPGTIDEHPNWRGRPAVALDDLKRGSSLTAVAEIMTAAGRSIHAPKARSAGSLNRWRCPHRWDCHSERPKEMIQDPTLGGRRSETNRPLGPGCPAEVPDL